MKFIIKLTFVFILFTGCNQNNIEDSLLWKIEGDDIKTSYLFGTMHVIPKKDLRLKTKMIKSLHLSSLTVLEADLDNTSIVEGIVKLSIFDNDSIENYASKSELDILKKFFKENGGTPFSKLNKLKPFPLNSTVTRICLGNNLASYEDELIKITKESGKEIEGLETPVDLIPIYTDTPFDEEIDEVIYTITNIEKTRSFYQKMIQFYTEENIQELYNYTDNYFADRKNFKQLLLDDRNKKWIPKIVNYSIDQSVFYGVGAAHLAGENGLINLLVQEGYRVTPILE